MRTWETNGVIIRGPLGEVLRGPSFSDFQEKVEGRKWETGGFHPNVANHILSKFLAKNGFENNWKTTHHKCAPKI